MRQHVFTSLVFGIAALSACGSDTSQQTPSSAVSGGPAPNGAAGVSTAGSMGLAAVSGAGGAPSVMGGRPGAPVAGSTPASSMTAGMGASAGMRAFAGVGGMTAGAGASSGADASAGMGANAGASGAAGAGMAPATGGGSCESLPATTDYNAPGPFNDAKMYAKTGPSDNYTIFRPSSSLGKDGFKHPVVTWGNGILTTPDMYQKLLLHVASHGFVIIGCNDTQAERPCLNAGMEWLVAQNTAAGELQGKLDVSRELALGYSWGGGGAIDVSDRPNIKATISLHGMPPRVTDIWGKLHAPLLLTTSTGDNFVPASMYVTPNYEKTVGQTFYGTLQDQNIGHLYIADKSAGICIGELIAGTFGTCGDAALEQAPTVAWLRYWACGDQGAKNYFYGDDCVLCKSPWGMPQRKKWQ